MNMNINIAYNTWLRRWLRGWLRNWKSCPLASLAPAMANLRPWNHLGSDLTMDLRGLCSHLAIIMCCLHIYTRERYRTNKYPNLRRTAPNLWMPAFSWTKGKEPIKHTTISIAETLELGSFLKIWDEMNISLHCSILVITKMQCWGKNTGKMGIDWKALNRITLSMSWSEM